MNDISLRQGGQAEIDHADWVGDQIFNVFARLELDTNQAMAIIAVISIKVAFIIPEDQRSEYFATLCACIMKNATANGIIPPAH